MSRQEAGRASGFSEDEEVHGIFRAWRVFAGGSIFRYCIFFLAIQVIASIVVLVLSKHEKPHVPLRAFIIGHLCGCALLLIILLVDFLSQKKFVTQMEDEISSDSTASDSFLVTFAIGQVASGCIKMVLGCFIMAWYITGCVWVSMASTRRNDTPQLFWTSLGFLILAASGMAVMILSSVAACCSIPFVVWPLPAVETKGTCVGPMNAHSTYKYHPSYKKNCL